MKILTFGTFDYLHPGHIAYLSEAASKGDLFIIVARDSNVRHIKGEAPDHTEEERIAALQEAFPDAQVRLGDTEDYLRPVFEINPDCIVLGYDQTLPPGISEKDLPCPIERAQPHRPDEFKSSILRKNHS
ncbi:MAG: adenylyltransferase/cytidyltransferase family protein [Candidatus Peregrinibacteria bacterium]|nr:adenylyltransferase/cytidyltransferase family protein [Candidatus Peregrinibacteria bacterium]MCB9807906.1 adenylyltransferase/cytidyltransferase family protein [Candidatus Peribacteria bacterium]